jgi:hypothetical protein
VPIGLAGLCIELLVDRWMRRSKKCAVDAVQIDVARKYIAVSRNLKVRATMCKRVKERPVWLF